MRPGALIVCATPRSGTTLLCDLLAASGATGRPNSFYRAQSMGDFARSLGVTPGADFDRRYLEAITAEGRGATDLFSMRLMWPSLPEMCAVLATLFPQAQTDPARVDAAFGTPFFLFVQRRDKVAQAVSRVRAEQSGLWHRKADGDVREQSGTYTLPQYDAARIGAYLAETEAHEAAWRDWFAASSIVPHELAYEDLSADPEGEVVRVLAAVGRNVANAGTVAPRTARLANAESREWIERYRREAR